MAKAGTSNSGREALKEGGNEDRGAMTQRCEAVHPDRRQGEGLNFVDLFRKMLEKEEERLLSISDFDQFTHDCYALIGISITCHLKVTNSIKFCLVQTKGHLVAEGKSKTYTKAKQLALCKAVARLDCRLLELWLKRHPGKVPQDGISS